MPDTPLRRTRTDKGITLEELAGLAGISQGYLSRVERGERNPSPEAKIALSRALRTPLAELFEPEGMVS